MKSNYGLKICLIVAFTAGLASLPAFGQRSAKQTFVSSNNRKAVLYDDGRLVFYDGIGQNARSITDVNCLNQSVISSKQVKYFVSSSLSFTGAGIARIYNDRGEKVGEFDIEPSWTVDAISDNGNLITLHKEFEV